jgi:FkbM family methyltransferase
MKIFDFIIKAIYLLLINPSLFLKYLCCRFKRLSSKWRNFNIKKFSKKFGDVIFSVDIENFGIDKLYIQQIYFDCYQLDIIHIMKKHLKPGNTFVDAGANLGYFTAIGANLVTKMGEVHAFEPAIESFKTLKRNKEQNPDYKIILNNCAVGDVDEETIMTVTSGETSGASSIVEEVIGGQLSKKKIKVRVVRLDKYIKKNKIKKISLIKIDVEGYEFPVLKGLENYFRETDNYPIIICEITPSAYPALKQTRTQLIDYMRQFGYKPYNIANEKLKIDITKFKEGKDIIFKVK